MKKNSRNKNKRVQSPKGGENKALARAMQEKRFSNAAQPHRTATDYRRKPKHPKKGWES